MKAKYHTASFLLDGSDNASLAHRIGERMTRTALYKGMYFALVGGGAIVGTGLFVHFHFSPLSIVVVIVIGLIPGRILGFFWRDLLRGLRLLNARDFARSKYYSERFLVTVRKRPWIKHLIWLGLGTYSRDPEVLALNNLGAAEIKLGEIDQARRHLESAIAMDPLCPLPFYNMGILLSAVDETAESERCFAQAARLGYRRSRSDRIVMASQNRFANTDGR
jgi:hypothetical protein